MSHTLTGFPRNLLDLRANSRRNLSDQGNDPTYDPCAYYQGYVARRRHPQLYGIAPLSHL